MPAYSLTVSNLNVKYHDQFLGAAVGVVLVKHQVLGDPAASSPRLNTLSSHGLLALTNTRGLGMVVVKLCFCMLHCQWADVVHG